MRKINLFLSISTLFCYCVHTISGSVYLLGLQESTCPVLPKLLTVLFLAHAVFGMVLSKESVAVGTKTKHWYLEDNKGFWAKRISGILIVLLVAVHIYTVTTFAFVPVNYILHLFFYIAVFAHMVVSTKSMFIKLGLENYKKPTIAITVMMAAVTVFAIFSTLYRMLVL